MRGQCFCTCAFRLRQLRFFLHPMTSRTLFRSPGSALISHRGQRSRVKFARAEGILHATFDPGGLCLRLAENEAILRKRAYEIRFLTWADKTTFT